MCILFAIKCFRVLLLFATLLRPIRWLIALPCLSHILCFIIYGLNSGLWNSPLDWRRMLRIRKVNMVKLALHFISERTLMQHSGLFNQNRIWYYCIISFIFLFTHKPTRVPSCPFSETLIVGYKFIIFIILHSTIWYIRKAKEEIKMSNEANTWIEDIQKSQWYCFVRRFPLCRERKHRESLKFL